MNRQRFAVIIVAVIGMITTFLPWYRVAEVGTISGMMSSGWFTFLLFILAIVLTLRKNLHEDMSMGVSWCVTICGMLASFVVLWRMIDVFFAKEGMFSLSGDMVGIPGSQVTVGYGAWIAVCAGLCVPLAAYLFRDRAFRRV